MSIGPDKTVDRFWCDVCNNWHTDSAEAPVTVCYYCGAFLCIALDYSCGICANNTCDNCRQVCQEDECDVNTCFKCVEQHLQTRHEAVEVR